jgi:hypothetical protein
VIPLAGIKRYEAFYYPVTGIYFLTLLQISAFTIDSGNETDVKNKTTINPEGAAA